MALNKNNFKYNINSLSLFDFSRIVQVKLGDLGEGTKEAEIKKWHLKEGDKVKFVVRFRGRELSYQQQGIDILRRIENDIKEHGAVEQMPKMEGKQMVMIVVPAKHNKS